MHRAPETYFLRLRQEATKLLGAVGTAVVPAGAVARWLGPSARDLMASPVANGVPAALVRHRARQGESPPDRDAIIGDAERIIAGEWSVLGQSFTVDLQQIRWDVHPLSGRLARRTHWSRSDLRAATLGDDVKFLWELNRHAQLLRLSQAWLLTGRAEFADLLALLLDKWIAQHTPGVGINWASALEVAFRGIAWCWIRSFTADSAIWTPDRDVRFRWMLWQHARFVERYDSRHHSPNTHLTGEALGLLCIGTHLPALPRAERWRSHGTRLLRAGLDSQLLPDGFHYERSVGYHRYTLEFALHAALLSPPGPDRDAFLHDLERAAEALHRLELTDGYWPAVGDDDGGTTLPLASGFPSDPCPSLAAAAALLRRPEFTPGCRPECQSLAWWLGIDASSSSTPVPRSRSVQLADAGFVIGRGSALDGHEIACMVSVGPHRGKHSGHAHSDIGHVEVVWGGRLLVADPGSPVYSSDLALRASIRHESAHACVALPHAPQAEPGGPFNWRRVEAGGSWTCREGEEYWIVQVERVVPDGAATGRHLRSILLIHGVGLLVLDQLQGMAGRAFTVSWPIARPVRAPGATDGTPALADDVEISCVAPRATQWRSSAQATLLARALGTFTTGTLLQFHGVAAERQLIASLFVPAGSGVCLRSTDMRIDIAQAGHGDAVLASVRLDTPDLFVTSAGLGTSAHMPET